MTHAVIRVLCGPMGSSGIGRLLPTATRSAAELAYNRVLTHIPVTGVHAIALRSLGAAIGSHVYFFSSTEVLAPEGLTVVGGAHIGRYCQLDARGRITIDREVVIAGHCLLITADHDPRDPLFRGRLAPIHIGAWAWLGSRATILKGVTVGEGAVISAGSVVTRDVSAWTIVAGNPAVAVGDRPIMRDYRIDYGPRFY